VLPAQGEREGRREGKGGVQAEVLACLWAGGERVNAPAPATPMEQPDLGSRLMSMSPTPRGAGGEMDEASLFDIAGRRRMRSRGRKGGRRAEAATARCV
jgi:hypothetical protein